MFIFLMRARAIIESLRLALAVGLALVTVETVSARPKKHHTERAAAAARARLACLQAIADQQRRDRVPVACARLRSCGRRQQPHHRAFYVRSCTNVDRVNRLQRAHEPECGGPSAPPRA